MKRFINYFSKRTKYFYAVFSVELVIIIGFIDYITGPEMSFSLFYFIPVARGHRGYLTSCLGGLTK